MSKRLVINIIALLFLTLPAFSQAVGRMTRHVRFGAESSTAKAAGITWTGGYAFEVTVPSAADATDENFGAEMKYRLLRNDSTLREGRVPVRYKRRDAGISVVLRVWPDGASVEAGSEEAAVVLNVDYDRYGTDTVGIVNPAQLRILRNTMVVDHMPPMQMADYENTDSIYATVAASEDPCVGIWEYLDRANNVREAVPGGSYLLATLPDGDGGYVLVYLDGAVTERAHWPAGRIKGRLSGTGFRNHYNVSWIDAYGQLAPAETYAEIDTYTGVLTVSFAELGTILRFRKL